MGLGHIHIRSIRLFGQEHCKSPSKHWWESGTYASNFIYSYRLGKWYKRCKIVTTNFSHNLVHLLQSFFNSILLPLGHPLLHLFEADTGNICFSIPPDLDNGRYVSIVEEIVRLCLPSFQRSFLLRQLGQRKRGSHICKISTTPSETRPSVTIQKKSHASQYRVSSTSCAVILTRSFKIDILLRVCLVQSRHYHYRLIKILKNY